jgi:AraC-like DNA-binding protein
MTPFSEYLNIFLVFLPLVFALQLLTYKNAYSKPNRVLGSYMILLAFYYFLNKIVVTEIPVFTYMNAVLVLPIFLAFNPFYFLYVKSLTNETFTFKIRDIAHFLPAIVFTVFLVILSVIPKDNDPESFEAIFNLRVPVAVAIYYLQVIAYTALMISLLQKHKKNLDQFFSYKENISLDWLWLFIIIYLLFTAFDAAVYFTHIFDAYYKLTYWVLMTLFVTFLGYFGTKQSDIYVGRMKRENTADSNPQPDQPSEVQAVSQTIDLRSSKYEKSSLAEDMKEEILKSIVRLMEDEELYKNPQLVVDDIAEKIHTNKKYISQVINEKLNRNFYQFVNEYRVTHVISAMDNPRYKNYTLEAIGDESGFNSRSSLITAFKKVTGKTPSDFKKQH